MDPAIIEEMERSLKKIAENTERIAESLELLSGCFDEKGRLRVKDAGGEDYKITEN